MNTIETARHRRLSLLSAAVFGVAGLLIAELIGWLWWVLADGVAWIAVVLAIVLALAALAGIAWYLSHARARRRLRAVLAAYADLEQSKGL